MSRLIFGALALSFAAACSSATATVDVTTGTGTSGTGGGGVQVDLDGGGDAATPPDGAALCPSGACNYQTGSGCSGATPSCVPIENASGAVAPTCVAAGTAGPGAACAQVTDCIAGYVCAQETCHKLCCGGDWTGCDSPNEHCIEALAYSSPTSGEVKTGAMLCYPVNTCDALTPTSCTQAGTSCVIVDATGATACIAAGTGEAGQPCPCAGGFACISEPMMGDVCVRLCKAVPGGGAPECQANEGVCTHYTRDPAGVGECRPPSSP